jgi:hypothetical protein
MTEDLLKGGETATPLQPLASERVPRLVHVEAVDSGGRSIPVALRIAFANGPGKPPVTSST